MNFISKFFIMFSLLTTAGIFAAPKKGIESEAICNLYQKYEKNTILTHEMLIVFYKMVYQLIAFMPEVFACNVDPKILFKIIQNDTLLMSSYEKILNDFAIDSAYLKIFSSYENFSMFLYNFRAALIYLEEKSFKNIKFTYDENMKGNLTDLYYAFNPDLNWHNNQNFNPTPGNLRRSILGLQSLLNSNLKFVCLGNDGHVLNSEQIDLISHGNLLLMVMDPKENVPELMLTLDELFDMVLITLGFAKSDQKISELVQKIIQRERMQN